MVLYYCPGCSTTPEKCLEYLWAMLMLGPIVSLFWVGCLATLGDSRPLWVTELHQYLVPPECWRHVVDTENPADCASVGLFTSKLIDYKLWWNGSVLLESSPDEWPRQPSLSLDCFSELDREVCHVATTLLMKPTCCFPEPILVFWKP